MRYCSPAIAGIPGSKFEGSPPGGSVEATPVNPSHMPFQLHLIGGKLLLIISLQEEALYGHMIQSRHPAEPSVPNENSKIPLLATLITIHVLFNSPAKRHPEFPDPGFVVGFETLFPSNSKTAPSPLGSMANVAFVHIFTASTQSLAVEVCPKILWLIRKRKIKRKTAFTTYVYT